MTEVSVTNRSYLLKIGNRNFWFTSNFALFGLSVHVPLLKQLRSIIKIISDSYLPKGRKIVLFASYLVFYGLIYITYVFKIIINFFGEEDANISRDTVIFTLIAPSLVVL